MLPDEMGMEGCPENNTLLYLILSALLVPFLFVLYKACTYLYAKGHKEKSKMSRRESMKSMEFAELQLELFGERALKNLKHIGSTHDLQKLASQHSLRSLKAAETGDVSEAGETSEDEGEYNNFMNFLQGGPKAPNPNVMTLVSGEPAKDGDENV